jgi:hypothetical protein
MNFRNKIIFLRWGVVSPTPNPHAGGPPLVGCPRLLSQYIRSYPPYLEAVPQPEDAPCRGDKIQSRTPNLISLKTTLILFPHLSLDLPKGHLPSGFNTKTLYAVFFYTMRTIFPAYFINLHLIILINFPTASNPRIQWSNPPVVCTCFSITCSSNKITYRALFPTKETPQKT